MGGLVLGYEREGAVHKVYLATQIYNVYMELIDFKLSFQIRISIKGRQREIFKLPVYIRWLEPITAWELHNNF